MTRTRTAAAFVTITGNTFPVKEELKKLGGRWNGAAKGWDVPAAKAEAAWALVKGAPRAPFGGASPARKPADFSGFQPTSEQAALLAFVQASEQNLFVEAGAGCGKTTTSLWLLGHMTGRRCMVAFNKSIKGDIEAKAPGDVEVMTMNALGYRAIKSAYGVRDLEVDNYYAWRLFEARFGTDEVRGKGKDGEATASFWAQVVKLYELARGGLAETMEDCEVLASSFDLAFDDEGKFAVERGAKIVLDLMAERAAGIDCPEAIDYVDQMWLPVARNLPMQRYDVLVIDEAQDTNAVQVEMLARCIERVMERSLAKGGRVIAVGDRRQAIYGFRGADSRAVQKIVERFDCKRLPLMTTFRCGKSIVREAQRYVPEFRAGENNHEGLVRTSSIETLLSEIKPGDFVLSRTNAPLIKGCISALSRGIPATVVGRDIGADLLKLAKSFKAQDLETFYDRLDAWRDKQIAKIERKFPVNETAIEAVRDRAACLEALADAVDTIDALYARCESLFTDTKSTARVEFSTAHKAKGRETERVFLLRDTFLRSRFNRATGEWVAPPQEEENVIYVAITRAKDELVYVLGEAAR
jgi:DNA helicase-2/ATP-dependent DNA helicase PcrA